MLDSKIINEIEEFVSLKPRSISEIATHIKKNWRTVDRYIEKIEKESGTISTRTFRGGTRGALKIVYWAAIESKKGTVFQKEMEEKILNTSNKNNFSCFDIYQHIEDDKKSVWKKEGEDEFKIGRLRGFVELLRGAKKEVKFFSGNMSFVNFKNKELSLFEELENLIKRDVKIKIISSIDFPGIRNVEKALSLNSKYGKELVEIRHREQPLRVTIIDGETLNLKEVKEPTGRDYELRKRLFIFYTIKDKEWAKWLENIFWKMWGVSIGSEKRLNELAKII